MAADSHSYRFRNSGPNHVSDGGSPEIVKSPAAIEGDIFASGAGVRLPFVPALGTHHLSKAGRDTHARPRFAKFANGLAILMKYVERNTYSLVLLLIFPQSPVPRHDFPKFAIERQHAAFICF